METLDVNNLAIEADLEKVAEMKRRLSEKKLGTKYIFVAVGEENTEVRVFQSTYTNNYHVQIWDLDANQPLPFCDIYSKTELDRAKNRAILLANNSQKISFSL